MREVQSRRASVEVVRGKTFLHEYANLYFDARNPMMYRLVKGDLGSDSLCVLCVSYKVFEIKGVVVADRNAASEYVRFMSPENAIECLEYNKIFAKNWQNPCDPLSRESPEYFDRKAKKCAEVLVPRVVPAQLIVGCLVHDKSTLGRVEEALDAEALQLSVKVYPDVFFEGGAGW